MRTRGPAHDETKRRIFDAARKLVLKKGHTALSLREVARAMRLSPASLYEYVDGRDALMDGLAREAAASLGRALDAAAANAETPRAAIVELGLAYVAWATSHREEFLLLFQGRVSKRGALEETVPQSSPYRLVVDAVRRCHPRATLAHVEQHAYGVWATAHGMAMLQLTHLQGFQADFRAADRAFFTSLVEPWA